MQGFRRLGAAEDADAVAEIARAAGFVITTEDTQRIQAQPSDDELESAARGLPTYLSCRICRGNTIEVCANKP